MRYTIEEIDRNMEPQGYLIPLIERNVKLPAYVKGLPISPDYRIDDIEEVIEFLDDEIDGIDFADVDEAYHHVANMVFYSSGTCPFDTYERWDKWFDKVMRTSDLWKGVNGKRIHLFQDYKDRIEASKDKCVFLLSANANNRSQYGFGDELVENLDKIEALDILAHAETIEELMDSGKTISDVMALSDNWEDYEQARAAGIPPRDIVFSFSTIQERNKKVISDAMQAANTGRLSFEQMKELMDLGFGAEAVELEPIYADMLASNR